MIDDREGVHIVVLGVIEKWAEESPNKATYLDEGECSNCEINFHEDEPHSDKDGVAEWAYEKGVLIGHFTNILVVEGAKPWADEQ